MRLAEKRITRSCNGLKYEVTTLYWRFGFDENELDPKLYEKFMYVEVEQRYIYRKELITYIKGCRTNWFGITTQDKLKKKMVEIVKDVMQKHDIEIESMWNTKLEYQ